MKKLYKNTRKILAGLICLSFLLLLSTAAVFQKKPDVPYVPTPENVVTEMLKMADVGKDDVLYDLGCGDGRIVIIATKELGCRGVGIDIDPQRIKESRENAVMAGVEDRVEFLLMDLFEADIREATVVTLYLLSRINLKLRPKLLRELEPGTRVVSHSFDMDQWSPDESLVIDDKKQVSEPYVYDTFFIDDYWDKHEIFLWVIPANVTGTWRWTMSGKRRYILKIDQTFQDIQARAFEGSSSIDVNVKDGKIKGNRLEFTLEKKQKGKKIRMFFEGIARGHTINGQVTISGRPDAKEKWMARRILSTYKSIEK
ncbi:MAG: methyltransferase domain-containing protein [Candidatus Aminicenantes bacterium]|jgi:SAM-dependent methyltransferase